MIVLRWAAFTVAAVTVYALTVTPVSAASFLLAILFGAAFGVFAWTFGLAAVRRRERAEISAALRGSSATPAGPCACAECVQVRAAWAAASTEFQRT